MKFPEIFMTPKEFIERTGADVKYLPWMDWAPMEAAYHPILDQIGHKSACFMENGPIAFYPVLFHELIHWTGAKNRLDRLDIEHLKELGNQYNQTKDDSIRFRDPHIIHEELIAEEGYRILCEMFNIHPTWSTPSEAGVYGYITQAQRDEAKPEAEKAVRFLLKQVKKNSRKLAVAA